MKQSSLSQFFKKEKKQLIKAFGKSAFWFSAGVALGLFLILSFVYIFFENAYNNAVYPGVTIAGVSMTGKTEDQIRQYFQTKNQKIENIQIGFQAEDQAATISAKNLSIGYNADLLAKQAESVGRSADPLSNISIIAQAYIGGVDLPASYTFSQNALEAALTPLKTLDVQPVDALFTFQNGRVTAFRPSSDGKTLDEDRLQKDLYNLIPTLFSRNTKSVTLPVTIKTLQPKTTTDKANNMGIKELIASGTSLFQHSIESRVYNVTLAANRLNGVLVAPNEVFSFDKALGDVSSFTGYKQAYVIQDGKTVLGDGGGVCQVSTTLFRAILNAGLPIVERHAHAYRVGYYEEDSPPGLDATVYVPTVDLKFKNDTGNYILIQTIVDPNELRLTFNLYGTNDGRVSTISTPVVTNQTPAPPDRYQDDPTLPKGVTKQVDFAAAGATATFKRTVTRNGQTLIAETYTSNYQPWQAVYLRGTKE